jgi:hypothetical protein
MGAFDLVADAHAARAQHAAVVVEAEQIVRGIERQLRIPVGDVDVRDPISTARFCNSQWPLETQTEQT